MDIFEVLSPIKEELYGLNKTTIRVSMKIKVDAKSISLLASLQSEKLELPLPASLHWNKNVVLSEIRNYEQSDFTPNTSVVGAQRVHGVNAVSIPVTSSSPRYLSMDFLIKNNFASTMTNPLKTFSQEVEDFFRRTNIESSIDVSYDIKIKKDDLINNPLGEPALSFENFKLLDITVNQAPFKIVDNKAFMMRLVFCEAKDPSDSLLDFLT